MTTAEVGAEEGMKRWEKVGEADQLLLRHCHWPRRSTGSLISLGVSCSPGND